MKLFSIPVSEQFKEQLQIADPFEIDKEGSFKVAGSGVSVQTEKALIREGVHPSQLDKEEAPPKPVEPKYKDTGESQAETYRRTFSNEALKKKKQDQQKQLEEILKKRGGRA